MLKNMKYVVYKEGKYYVSQCLNVDVSSFGITIQEAVDNLREAVELYFDDEASQSTYQIVDEAVLGEVALHV